MGEFVNIINKRIDLRDDNRLIIQMVSSDEIMKDVRAVSYVNGKSVPVQIVKNDRAVLKFAYRKTTAAFDSEYNVLIDIPDKVKDVVLELSKETYPAGKRNVRIKGSAITRLRNMHEYTLDSVTLTGNKLLVSGWCAAAKEAEITIVSEGSKVDTQIERKHRPDINRGYLEGEIAENSGFVIPLDTNKIGKEIKINFKFNNKTITRAINIDKVKEIMPGGQRSYLSRAKAYISFYGFGSFVNKLTNKVSRYVANYGVKSLVRKIVNKLLRKDGLLYDSYFKSTYPDKEMLQQQREYSFKKQCKFSIIIPVYRPDKNFFMKMLDSVVSQTYSGWQLCIADGSGETDSVEDSVNNYIRQFGEDRIRYTKLDNNLGIAGNTNAALKLADGDYIVFGDHDDELHPAALFECMRILEKMPDVDFIYTDEDKVIGGSGRHTEPHFKSGFNYELLRRTNYICHLVVAKSSLINKVGMLDSRYDGAQDYDYVLRCVEQAEHIEHIPKVLYHWRISERSTAMGQGAKNYADEAGRRAVEAHLNRIGIAGRATLGVAPFIYDVEYELEGGPLVSVVIPNKDHIDDLKLCINSIEKNSGYRNYEFVIVENNSTQEATFEYYRELERTLGKRVKVVYWKDEFNYSAINNYGVRAADGEYILLLNNDIELIEPDTIRSMLSYCQRKDVGIVGARLLYADNTVQHAGVVLGFHGVAGHAFCGRPDAEYGYFARSVLPQELSAVTAACLMTKKAVYEQVGGLDEQLKVAFNDIDYCMAVRKAGYKVIYDAKAKLYHYESKSRGMEDTPEKQERFNSEVLLFSQKWEEELDAGDFYYNPNLSLEGNAYTIKEY